MAILESELKWYKSLAVSDLAANGGRMSNIESVSGVKNNIWPDVGQAERTAGSIKYRKMFLKVENDDDLVFFDSRVFVETPTPGEDIISIFVGTQNDTQASITGSERLYGAGKLANTVSSGVTQIVVNSEGVAFNHFQNGDTLRVSDQIDVNDTGGKEDIVTISSAIYAGDQVTITFSPALANAYSNTNTRCATMIDTGDVSAAFSNFIETTSGGTYNEGVNPPILDSIGTIQQNWTVTFTSATNYNLSGDVLGSVSSGNITSNFAPNNPAFGKPYLTLPSAAWGGTWTTGDTITFTTSPAAIPLWYRRDVPAGSNSFAGNKAIIGFEGESA